MKSYNWLMIMITGLIWEIGGICGIINGKSEGLWAVAVGTILYALGSIDRNLSEVKDKR